MKKILLVAALTVAGCAPRSGQVEAQAKAQAAPDSARLMRTISVLAHDSMEGRQVGTAGSAKARKFLLEEFRKRGIKTHSDTYEQTFKMRASRTGTDSIVGTNIIGMIRGKTFPNRYIVVSAHYDHLGTRNGEVFNGADDNASGTAGILEVASWFAAHPPSHTILFAAFDAEERGDVGSKMFLTMNKGFADSVLVDINLDMIGRNAANELFAAGTSPYPVLLPYVTTAAGRTALKLRTGHDTKAAPGYDWTNQSDHGAFHERGVPYIYFGVEDHPDYHKATDEIAGIMPGFYVNAVRVVLDVVKQIDANPFTYVRTPR